MILALERCKSQLHRGIAICTSASRNSSVPLVHPPCNLTVVNLRCRLSECQQ